MKKHLYKAALLAALGLAAAPSAMAASANGDVVAGMNDILGGTGNDYVIDMGSYTQFTTSSSVTASIDSSLFTAAFGGDVNALNNVAAGVVAGGGNPVTTQYLFGTEGGAVKTTITAVSFLNAWNSAFGPLTGEYTAAGSATNPTWDYEVATGQGSTHRDTSGTGVSSKAYTSATPESLLSSGIVAESLWVDSDTAGVVSGWSQLGSIYFNATGSAVTENVNGTPTTIAADSVDFFGTNFTAAVPEPSTYGIFAGVGVLILGLRRQLTGKIA
jgi:hypothetical protein